jgi:hypothetical protein
LISIILFRTLGAIRKLCKNYHEACKSWNKKGKMSAKLFKNCVNNPLLTSPDETEILEVFPPGELHLLTGIFNRLYDLCQTILTKGGHTFDVSTWATACGLERSGQYGGQFTGNQCSKLLDNLDLLSSLANSQESAPGGFDAVIECLKSLKVNIF